MHIPDGYLSPAVWATLDGISAATVGITVKKVSRDLDSSKVSLMGLMGAFVFAAQMVNFPVGGGTSGHLLGSVLMASLLGVGPAILVMTVVFVVQALLFGDGGLLVLGANLFNMGIVGCLLGGAARGVAGRLNSEILYSLTTGAAAWIAVMAGAALTSVEIGLSGHAPLAVILAPMLAVHAVIGVGEALITVAAMKFLSVRGIARAAQVLRKV